MTRSNLILGTRGAQLRRFMLHTKPSERRLLTLAAFAIGALQATAAAFAPYLLARALDIGEPLATQASLLALAGLGVFSFVAAQERAYELLLRDEQAAAEKADLRGN